ncbi:PRD domain-containing protein [Bifidobacterium reuteri]|uniref:BglG transcriptional antiterminator n=2 Tax=Bifidobacterium reuteri TaxID=983706 RepID=A0A087CTY3_9BIFI|nr:PRD domain-containing protein [Bifidobacterium reuteri]KFI86733.1 BglG transcriptional antiterminator [Bifidobacterium reuteri DSM 23975]TPF78879.1 transcription antiterminator BglG [Bifidobacterium sp. UTCIF-1]TPF82532.1 transcription antiterminator BglG [Bifidobacterium sp. UTCIF-3]
MEILRVFNNNVVLAKDGNGGEVILTGRGLGFQARPGQSVDESKIVRTFVPSDGRDPDHLAQMLAGIAPETIRLVVDAMKETGLDEHQSASATLVLALSDHIAGAVERRRRGIDVAYPLIGEVRNLYPREYEQGRSLLAAINSRLDAPLPDGEATSLAMHLVNAGFATGDLTYTYTMTGVIQQMLDIIEKTYGLVLDRESVNVGRFITHLRYLFIRVHQHRQLDGEPAPIIEAIRAAYPKAIRCASTIRSLLELRLDADISEDEVAYLAMHVARVTADAERAVAVPDDGSHAGGRQAEGSMADYRQPDRKQNNPRQEAR